MINIAIDGPAGAGKSTIAKLLAEKLEIVYVDTGAMYRAIGYYVVQNSGLELDFNKNFDDELLEGIYSFVESHLDDIQIDLKYSQGVQQIYLNSENVSQVIRTPKLGQMASIVSANKAVRLFGVKLQQELASNMPLVMDGRDIGTFVLPKAPLKIFLTASSIVRAKRRYNQLIEKGEKPILEELQKEIEERDHRDMNRDFAPLVVAKDAIEVDTSAMNIEEVVGHLYQLSVDIFKL